MDFNFEISFLRQQLFRNFHFSILATKVIDYSSRAICKVCNELLFSLFLNIVVKSSFAILLLILLINSIRNIAIDI